MDDELSFARGDHGGNTIGLITAPSLQILKQRYGEGGLHDLGVLLMSDAYLGCDQIGFLGDRQSVLAMSRADEAEIPMCGGVVQVYGAFVRMTSSSLASSAVLRFPSLSVSFTIEPERILADVSLYVEALKANGCKPLPHLGPTAYKAGHILVLSTKDVPPADKNGKFLDPGTLSRLSVLHESFARSLAGGAHSLVYYSTAIEHTDPTTGARKVHVDAVFPHGLTHRFSEPSCGTGSAALALALDTKLLIVHCGGSRWTLGGPCKAHVLHDDHGRHLYWHDTVRVTSTGRVHL